MRRPVLPGVFAPAIVLLSLLFAAAALRFYRLTFQSLWVDELFSVVFSSSKLPLSEIVAVYAKDVHPLGYPLLLHWWLTVFGDTDVAARALSAVIGILAVAVIFVVGRRIFDDRTGLIVATLTTVNAFHIAYSQEVRPYPLVFLVASLSYWAFLSLLARPGWGTALAFAVVNGFALHVHYYALVMVGGQFLVGCAYFVVTKKGWRTSWPLIAGTGLAGAALLPWVGPLFRAAEMRDFWPKKPTPVFFAEYFHTYFGRNLLLTLILAALLVGLPWLLRREQDGEGEKTKLAPRRAAVVLGAAVAVSLFTVYLRSVLTVPMMLPRMTIIFLPVVLLLIALAISRIRSPGLRVALVSGVVLLSLINLARSGYYTEPRKEQWREAVQHMLSDPRFDADRDLCFGVLAPGFQFYVDQFGSSIEVLDPEVDRLLEVQSERSELRSLWLLVARRDPPSADFKKTLNQRWVKTDRTQFLNIAVERWEPRVEERKPPSSPDSRPARRE